MKLLSKTHLHWHEPLLFVVRLREAGGWMRRLLLALGLSLVMFAVMYFTGQQRMGLVQQILVSFAAGTTLVALLDTGNLQREVTVHEDSITCSSAVGTMWTTSFPFAEVNSVALIPADRWKLNCAAMTIQTSDDLFLMGIPGRLSLTTIASVLHRLGVMVQLEGWEPSESDTRIQVTESLELSPEEARGLARVWPIEAHESSLTPPSAMAVSLVIALGPLLVSLITAVGAGIWIWKGWGTLPLLSKLFIAAGGVLPIIVSFVYLVLMGQFLAARYNIGIAKNILRTRTDTQVNGFDDDLIPVEIFDRTAWTSVVAKSTDFGFLQIDASRRRLLFEGNRNRWEIPLTALTACRIEESHVGSEANEHAEKRYFVVIAAACDGEPWEAGMIHTRTDIGHDGKPQRHARAQTLFRQIADAV